MRCLHSYVITLLLIWVQTTQGFNGTITTPGWRSEPDGRGTWSILWTCLVTIFLCTWSSLHLSVKDQHDWWYLFFRQVRWMLLVALIPEILVYKSARNFFEARAAVKCVKEHDCLGWTQTHCQFAANNGFRICRRGRVEDFGISRICYFAKKGRLNPPPISKDELNSRSKTDWIAKLITILQAGWFVIQVIFRAAEHLDITSLEFLTASFVLCTIMTYGFCFLVPQNVGYPVIIQACEIEKAKV